MSILTAKLYIPRLPPQSVPRPRLIALLEQGRAAGRKLSLVSAGPGFGKTTLVAAWAAACQQPVTWLALDAGDNDLVRFLSCLVAALQRVHEGIGQEALALLQSAQPPPSAALLADLLNGMAAAPAASVLVLDDWHVIENAAVKEALAFLVDHLPPALHLVIASRSDPEFPLGRLRARGELTEVRAAELRFTPAEAADFLNRVMGLNLAAAEIAGLEARTEGWIAGLQLAALSLQGRADDAAFVQAFAGSHRFVLDYLVEEVLGRQPAAVRTFLLQTAILERLAGPLCDAVTGGEDGAETLAALERGNMFLVPLDDHRRWYRYHHLFAEALRARLAATQPDRAADLHRRASAWCAANGLSAEAIRHALAAGDFARAAFLIELEVEQMRAGQAAAWLGWAQALPADEVHRRPVLSVYLALALLPGELQMSETCLQAAEGWLAAYAAMSGPQQATCIRSSVADAAGLPSLPGTVSIVRAYRAGAMGDLAGALHHARQALESLPAHDRYWRSAASALLGIAYWASGDLAAADKAIAAGMAAMQHVRPRAQTTDFVYLLADIRLAQGRLHEAAGVCRQALQQVAASGRAPQGAADLYVILAEVHLERNELEEAAGCLVQSKQLGALAGLPEAQHRWYVAQALLADAGGDQASALAYLEQAERFFLRGPTPDHRPIGALRARVWLRQGRLPEARGWARTQELSIDDDLVYVREFEHITLARLLLAELRSTQPSAPLHALLGFLARLMEAAQGGDRLRSMLEILLLQAQAQAAHGDGAQALALAARAQALAQPEGFVRLLVGDGLALPPGRPAAVLVEPLSEREVEVLRLLGSELSGPQIASRLVVSLNTLHTHARHIYGKLGVNSRRAAVHRAQELGLL